MGRAEKRLRDAQRECNDAWTARTDALLSLSRLEKELEARCEAKPAGSEDGESEDEEWVFMRAEEVNELRAENKRLRAALMLAHASGVRTNLCP